MTDKNPAPAAVDLSNFDSVAAADEGRSLELRNPKTGEVLRFPDGTPFTITLRGRDSTIVTTMARRLADKRVQERARTNTMTSSLTVDQDNIELLAAATKSWNFVLGGETPVCSVDTARTLYAKYPWIYEQCDQFVGNRVNFLA